MLGGVDLWAFSEFKKAVKTATGSSVIENNIIFFISFIPYH
jgi:hypothetical protein